MLQIKLIKSEFRPQSTYIIIHQVSVKWQQILHYFLLCYRYVIKYSHVSVVGTGDDICWSVGRFFLLVELHGLIVCVVNQ